MDIGFLTRTLCFSSQGRARMPVTDHREWLYLRSRNQFIVKKVEKTKNIIGKYSKNN